MTDITDRMYLFRECARSLWNNYLRPDAEPYVDFDALDHFDELRAALFDRLVLRAIGRSWTRRPGSREACPFLNVRPREGAPLLVNRPSPDGNMYWDEDVGRLAMGGLGFLFVDYFDWDRFGFVDFQYYRVKIITSVERRDLVGREALVEVRHAVVSVSHGCPDPM